MFYNKQILFIDINKEEILMSNEGIIFCDKCGFAIDRQDEVIVTESGKVYCFRNKCAYGISEEETKAFEGSPGLIFCHKCGEIIPEERRNLDNDERYFCSDECKFGTCLCGCCKRIIKEGEPRFPIKKIS